MLQIKTFSNIIFFTFIATSNSILWENCTPVFVDIDPETFNIDPTKIETELGWKPVHNFDTGIIETIKWNLDNQEWLSHVESGEYKNWMERQYDRK